MGYNPSKSKVHSLPNPNWSYSHNNESQSGPIENSHSSPIVRNGPKVKRKRRKRRKKRRKKYTNDVTLTKFMVEIIFSSANIPNSYFLSDKAIGIQEKKLYYFVIYIEIYILHPFHSQGPSTLGELVRSVAKFVHKKKIYIPNQRFFFYYYINQINMDEKKNINFK